MLNLFKKENGSGYIIAAIVSAVILGSIGLSYVKLSSSVFGSLSSSDSLLQAQQYAIAKAEVLKGTEYSLLKAQIRTDIADSDSYQDEVILGEEKLYSDSSNIKERICIIKIYKKGDLLPRVLLRVPKISVTMEKGVPKGGIVSWVGNINDIPDGYALCDGQNGTPDLSDRFLVGAGKTYNVGATGGVDEVTLEVDQSVSHYHGVGDYYQGNNNGAFLGLNRNETFILPPGGGVIGWNGSNHGGYYSAAESLVGEQITSLAIGCDASKPHENRPPYFAVYYIMKV